MKINSSYHRTKNGVVKHNPTKRITLNAAFAAGKRAYMEGKPRVFAQDKRYPSLLHGIQAGQAEPIMKEWYKGWDEENLKPKYNFEKSLDENSKHMDRIKKKYKNHTFTKDELFGY